MEVAQEDIQALIQDKYDGDQNADIADDVARLAAGEPLAYVIGWLPFLELKINLDSRPLIPRPETEWWTEALIERIGNEPLRVLDLCAGSGAIGLSVLKYCPNARVSFGELIPEHAALVEKNLVENQLDASRASIRAGDLFEAFAGEQFDIIATNPPYIPDTRELGEEVTEFEPPEALFAGPDGLAIIERVVAEAREYLAPLGSIWIECDIDNIERAQELLLAGGAERAELHNDPYGRPRLVVGYYP
ncbi:MAG: release factor glutamine methyltransferase [Parcubacteria bacterium C7867-001]|nr:MAG: release factor glutamine methyltransferase [Parcubacteria bacterium C7867-001]